MLIYHPHKKMTINRPHWRSRGGVGQDPSLGWRRVVRVWQCIPDDHSHHDYDEYDDDYEQNDDDNDHDYGMIIIAILMVIIMTVLIF